MNSQPTSHEISFLKLLFRYVGTSYLKSNQFLKIHTELGGMWYNLLINKQLHRKVRGSGFINYGNVCSSYISISIWHLTATLAWVHPIDSSTYCRCYLMCMIRKQLRPTYREHFLGQQGKLSELAWLPAGPGFINVCINT